MFNVNDFYDGLISFLDHVVEEAFLKPIHRDMLIVEDDLRLLLNAIQDYQAPHVSKWINREDT